MFAFIFLLALDDDVYPHGSTTHSLRLVCPASPLSVCTSAFFASSVCAAMVIVTVSRTYYPRRNTRSARAPPRLPVIGSCSSPPPHRLFKCITVRPCLRLCIVPITRTPPSPVPLDSLLVLVIHPSSSLQHVPRVVALVHWRFLLHIDIITIIYHTHVVVYHQHVVSSARVMSRGSWIPFAICPIEQQRPFDR